MKSGSMLPRYLLLGTALAIALWLARGAVLAAAPDAASQTCQWELSAADCHYLVLAHERLDAGGNDQPAEMLEVRAGAGTHVYAERPLAPGRIIDDLEVDVWVRASRPGLQVFARIVVPDAIDPHTGQPETVLVAGESYQRVGQWQRLTVHDVPKLFHRQMRVLRARLGQPVSDRNAYVSAVALNVYAGPGTSQIWIGQLNQRGAVPPDEAAFVQPVTFTSTPLEADELPHRRISRLIVEGRPFFPRVIEYQGEPLKLLRELGFNAVAMSERPTPPQYEEAARSGLWIVCPPPDDEQDELAQANRVLAWYCGFDSGLESYAPDYLDQVRLRDPLARPVLASLRQDQWRLSREVDIVLRKRQPIGSSFELSHYEPWLFQMTHLVRPGTPFWASVQSELSAPLIEQVRGLIGSSGHVPRSVQVEQVRQMALAAVSAGARGLWFHSATPLNEKSPDGQLRRQVLELINRELELLEPWAMGGNRIGVVDGHNAEVRVISLATARSRLLIPTVIQPHAQYVSRPVAGGNTLVIPGVPDSINVFRMDPMGLTPLPRERISGGLRIEVGAEAVDSLLLLTEDPLIVTHINQTVAGNRRRVVELEQQIADTMLRMFESQASREMLARTDRVSGWEAARSALQQSRVLSAAGDLPPAHDFAQRARRELDRLQADLWQQTLERWPTPLLQPTGAAFGLAVLPHWSTADLALSRRWSENRLRGGECENLTYMIDAGWRQHQTSPNDVFTYLALSPHQPHSGQHCLRMLVSPQTDEAEASVVEFAPVWVHTAPVTVEAGQHVRITGWVRIDEPIRGSLDGCMISDSVSGLDLALRYRRTDGWEPFELIRTMTRSDHLTVTFTLHGLGEVKIDDVRVTIAEP